MKLHVLSDLHLEFAERYPPFVPPATDAAIVILAGDIDNGTQGIDWAEDTFPHQTVLYVPGNHEFYDRDWSVALHALRQRASASHNVHVMDHDVLVVDGVRFLGATLWTDFELYGRDKLESALMQAQAQVMDFRCIRFGGVGFLTPQQTIRFHREALAFLQQNLLQPFDGKTVVVTHHAPHPASVHPRWNRDFTSASFVSDLSQLLGRSALWVHGHTHDSFDYTQGSTRVLANPMGYRRLVRAADITGQMQVSVRYENTRFDPHCVVSI